MKTKPASFCQYMASTDDILMLGPFIPKISLLIKFLRGHIQIRKVVHTMIDIISFCFHIKQRNNSFQSGVHPEIGYVLSYEDICNKLKDTRNSELLYFIYI